MTTRESKGRFFLLNELIRINSHNESNRFKLRIGMLYQTDMAHRPQGPKSGQHDPPGPIASMAFVPHS